MLQMTKDIVTALKTTYATFKERGISKIQGESGSVITNHLESVFVSSNEVDSLPEEAPLDILKLLSIFSCGGFKNTFQFQETEERINNNCKKHVGGSTTPDKLEVVLGGSTTLDQVNVVLWETNGLYNSLCNSVKFNVINRGGYDKYL